MKSYAEREVFTVNETQCWRRARAAVEALDRAYGCDDLRCHELARAVGMWLGLQVQDGHFGYVEHSWLWTQPLDPELGLLVRSRLPNVLDVYVPGELPQVQLVHMHTGLPAAYRHGELRTDIRKDIVDDVYAFLYQFRVE
jgi:hypothetical protein